MSSSIPDPVPDDATPEQLRHILNYWRQEAICNTHRWEREMETNTSLKAEVESLSERINQMEASWPRCSHNGGKVYGKVYLSSFHETTEPAVPHNPGRLFSEIGESDEVARLKAENERLRKAGDAMARVVRSFGFDEASNAWNAAKEVQP